ncbi:DUF5134 domain-containing protein [Streptomyces sp. DSM 44917]|uniref:DUF5134 domain-containing protein n=1 Tax=Streptomyces boetiae TaxID=3075541 RepID=A0ABU2LFH7_9ACTN|nr:DUF5134 domain-containing protein [Streptomyces sp. DSM 44917]MDT0309923.1 DUF5134 domain-containing protein [Streptomyces sp. DSM 44917]
MHGHGPELVGWLLVALCGATGGYCGHRLWREHPGRGAARRPAAVEAAMGLGMAAMAVPLPAAVPRAGAAALFAVFFGALALRAAALRRAGAAHQGHHAVEALAMVYMAAAMAAAPAGSGHGAHAPAGIPAVTGALLAYFALYALLAAPRLLPAAAPAGAGWAAMGAPGGRGECGGAPGGRAGERPGHRGGGLPAPGRARSRAAGTAEAGRSPEVAAACRLALALGMVAMLLGL